MLGTLCLQAELTGDRFPALLRKEMAARDPRGLAHVLSLVFRRDTGLGAYGMWPVRAGGEGKSRPSKAGHSREAGL